MVRSNRYVVGVSIASDAPEGKIVDPLPDMRPPVQVIGPLIVRLPAPVINPALSVTGALICDALATSSVPPSIKIASLLVRLLIDCVPLFTSIVGLAANEMVTSSPGP